MLVVVEVLVDKVVLVLVLVVSEVVVQEDMPLMEVLEHQV